MSILPYCFNDPLCCPDYYRRFALQPFREIERLDRTMNSLMNQLQIAPEREISAQMQYNENGDLCMRCQTAGFKPEELNVDLEGQRLTITGKHQEEREGESIERHFTRIVRLPKEMDPEKIKCELDNNGELCVQIPRLQSLEAPKQNVPIEMKKPEGAQQ